MTRDERDYLNKLSKEVFGSTSHWQKLIKHGERVQRTSTTKKGETISVIRFEYPTVENIKDVLERRSKEINRKNEVTTDASTIELSTGDTSPGDSGGSES